jgi:hypothetical protein
MEEEDKEMVRCPLPLSHLHFTLAMLNANNTVGI